MVRGRFGLVFRSKNMIGVQSDKQTVLTQSQGTKRNMFRTDV